MRNTFLLVFSCLGIMSISYAQTIRFATFNVSMEASNYLTKGSKPVGNELFTHLARGEHQQIRNIAQIIQQVRPDIILLNEFDYTANEQEGVLAFIKHYLAVPQNGAKAINYPYYYSAPVNTGVPSGVDLNHNASSTDTGADAFGFGLYPGQYGMVLLSRFPIQNKQVKSFQHFLWKDMPNSLIHSVKTTKGKDWYSAKAKAKFRLSSKSHWDVPINIDGTQIHILASHPTPPVFDGPENRNGKRNHDEIRFWHDYISGGKAASYIYDDNKAYGGIKSNKFVILGDLNASPDEGDGNKQGIQALLENAALNNSSVPLSLGGQLHTPNNPIAGTHTAAWRMRADYVLPSKAIGKINDSGVFWPNPESPDYVLIKDREASSDHRLVWLDIELNKDINEK